MDTSSSIGALALSRFQAMQEQHSQAEIQKPTESNNITSIEVPAAIRQLNIGSDYWVALKTKRYQKLIREGHLADLLELATLALTKTKPANWFAKVCSVKAWERTLDFLKKRHAAIRRAEQVAERLGKEMVERMHLFIYKQIWAGKSVERHAVAAQELGKNRHKLFAWLCRQEGQGHTA
ncbi:MAG TPA: hypothetical protein VFV38_11885 [Ktedonobacteraceae bacterium]|nr:hypothetical protein [Ktedonobacteraceae bacterium]